jgi:hypothetical protein
MPELVPPAVRKIGDGYVQQTMFPKGPSSKGALRLFGAAASQ